MTRVFILLRIAAAAAMLITLTPGSHAVVIEDFTFSDSNGTLLENAQNVANPGNLWVASADMTNSSVSNGAYRIQKDSTNLASNYIDIANITSGKAWIVAEMSGWSFTATASTPSEQVRFAFLDNDNMPPSGSTITAQMDIRRSGTGLALVGIGALGTGATDIAGSYLLPLVRTTPFTMVLELDKDADQYSVYYKDNAAAFQLLGTGNLGLSTLNPGDRDGNSIRFAPTGQFNDAGEFFDINRIYLTNETPIVGPVDPVVLTLEVRSNGQVSIVNNTTGAVSLDSYRITSASNSLNFAGWNSLSDQGLDAVNGGNDPGEIWDESGGSDNGVLAESFLLGSSTIAQDGTLSLGGAFQLNGSEDLMFRYRDTVSGAVAIGEIEYVTVAGVNGDYNNNGIVDAADYTVWRDNLGSTTAALPNDAMPQVVDQSDYTVWKNNFGSTAGSGSGLASRNAIPEPAAWLLAGMAAAAFTLRQRQWSVGWALPTISVAGTAGGPNHPTNKWWALPPYQPPYYRRPFVGRLEVDVTGWFTVTVISSNDCSSPSLAAKRST